MKKAIFVDRDGTIIVEPEDESEEEVPEEEPEEAEEENEKDEP